MTEFLFLILLTAISAVAWAVYYFSSRSVARREGRRMSRSFEATDRLFAAIDDVPERKPRKHEKLPKGTK